MGKIFRYFKAREWLLVAGCALFVLVEVFAELKMPEYVGNITTCIESGAPTKEVWLNGMYMLLGFLRQCSAQSSQNACATSCTTR